MVHLRIVSPPDRTEQVLEVLECTPAVINVIVLEGAARTPDGDVILCDVAREDASVVLVRPQGLGIHRGRLDRARADRHARSPRHAEPAEKHARGAPADAVVWEEVEERTNENVELSAVVPARSWCSRR